MTITERNGAWLGLALLLVSGVVLLTRGPAWADQRRVEIYRPASRVAAELLPVARAALGSGGEATVDTGSNALVLVGADPAVRAALDALQALDRPRATIVMRYEAKRVEDLDTRGVRIDWNTGTGDLRIGNVVFPEDETGVRATGFALRSERQGGLSGLVRVLDGETGRIGSGASVPVRSRGLYGGNVTIVTAESGFEAQPRLLGDGRVQVAIRPTEAHIDRRGNVAFVEGATTVIVQPGETVAVGGIAQNTESHESGSRVFGASQRAASERVLLLSVAVEGAASAD